MRYWLVVAVGIVISVAGLDAAEESNVVTRALGSAVSCPLKIDMETSHGSVGHVTSDRGFWLGPHFFGDSEDIGFYGGSVSGMFLGKDSKTRLWGELVADPIRQLSFMTPDRSGAWQPRNLILAEDTIIQGSVIPKGSEVWFDGYGVFHGLGEVRINVSKEAVIMGRKVGPAHVVIRGLKMTVNKDKNGGQDD